LKEYLTAPKVLAIHSILIQRYGGTNDTHDRDALESALFRLQYNPFVDDNKRVAFAATDIFLRMNSFRINCESMIIYVDMMQMFETDTFDFAHLEPWLRKLVIKTS